ncbi:MAG: AAA family ATPase [Candidatus Liptonbacteria bacterium]
MPHLLKKLELNGFKSFAQRTILDFPEGITAIVGPNGSGKSNVIDAIRWLLGEREAKNLRGAKSEDLIFAGTAKRPRMGQAYASLHFDNSSGFFPVDFSEIIVTRQASRDGNNQYFINKAEVRLKDIIDFFAQARLGSRGLVVVTQGNSDVFIQSTPIERREMIEEMLGLREYQLKKNEAEKRLKNTQINLDKIQALTEEILPHLRSLKRQTGRWEKRSILEQELRDLENRFFGSAWQEIQSKKKVLEADLTEHQKRFGQLSKDKVFVESKLAKVEASQPEERKELHEIKERTQKLLEERNALQKEIGRLEAQLEYSPAIPKKENASDTGELLALVKKIRTKLEIGLDDPEKLKKAAEEILKEVENFLASNINIASGTIASPQNQEIKNRFEKIKKDINQLEDDLKDLAGREKQLEKNQESFYREFKLAVAELESAKEKMEKWHNAEQQKKFELEKIGLHIEEWSRQVEQSGRQQEEFQRLEAFSSPGEEEKKQIEHRIFRLRGDLASIGEVDEVLLKEARETEERYEFLRKESADLEKAKIDLRALIVELNEKVKTEFGLALVKINEEFEKFFAVMFGGGQAKLKLEKSKTIQITPEAGEQSLPETHVPDEVKVEKDEEVEVGLEIDLKLPRKRINSLDVLSGGERSLVGIAALFALISVSPPPFLVLDEVDASLDERNTRRFSEMLKEFAKHSQFVLVTHNRATMEVANLLYGVTMNDDGTSKVLSLSIETQ